MGGKSKAKAPNYTPLANASAEAARYSAAVANRIEDRNLEAYRTFAPMMLEVGQLTMESQREQMDQARDYYNYYKDTYRPIEEEIAQRAMEFDSDAYRNKMTTEGLANLNKQYGIAQEMENRRLMSMGVNPNSGAARNSTDKVLLAAQKAGMMTDIAFQADQMGLANLANAVQIGKGLPGLASNSYTGALNAANSVGQQLYTPHQQYMSGIGQAYNARMGGINSQIGGLTSIMNTQGSIYNNNSGSSPWGTMAGLGVGWLAGGPVGARAGQKMADAIFS